MQNAAVPAIMPTYNRAPLSFERGEGPYLLTADGRRYLDFGTGIATASLGHAHPHLVESLREQAGKVWHVSNLYEIAPQRELAERLVAHSFADTVFFANSGAEAMEACIKLARRFQHARGQERRHRIVTFDGAFHGRTIATISSTGKDQYLAGFRPELPGFDHHTPIDDLDAVAALIGDDTAAIMIEPVQGEGGIRQVAPAFLRGLRRLCDEHDLLLIFDEVQTGMGRTGTLFAYEQAGVEPDIMGLAKGLGGGFPIGACLATARAASGMAPGTHGSTFGGNPLACAVGGAVLDVLLAPGFFERLRGVALHLQGALRRLQERHPHVLREVRGLGLMIGLRVGPPNGEVVGKLIERGLLAVPAAENVVRLLPPLTITAEHVDEAAAALDAAFAGFER